MDLKSYDLLLILKATIEDNKQNYDEKMKKLTEDLTAMIASMMYQIKTSKYSSDKKYSSKSQGSTTLVPANKRYPPFEGGHSTKIGGMWTLKHEISSPRLYELLIKTKLKGENVMDLNNFYIHIKMYINICLNAVNRPQEDLLLEYQYIKIHS